MAGMKTTCAAVLFLACGLVGLPGQSVTVNGQVLTWPSGTWPLSLHPCGAAPWPVQVPGVGRNLGRMTGPAGAVRLEVVSNGMSPGLDAGAACLFVYSLGADLSCAGVPMAAFDPAWTGLLLVDLGAVVAVEAGTWNGFDWLDDGTWFTHTLELPEAGWPLQPGWTWFTQGFGVSSAGVVHGNPWLIENQVAL